MIGCEGKVVLELVSTEGLDWSLRGFHIIIMEKQSTKKWIIGPYHTIRIYSLWLKLCTFYRCFSDWLEYY